MRAQLLGGSLLKNIAFRRGSGFVVRILGSVRRPPILANAHIEQATLRVDMVQQMLAFD